MAKKFGTTQAPFTTPSQFLYETGSKNGGLLGLRAMRRAEAEFRKLPQSKLPKRDKGRFLSNEQAALLWKQRRAIELMMAARRPIELVIQVATSEKLRRAA